MSKMDYPDIDDPSWISTPEERAYNYARSLAEILASKHFPANPNWQPFPDLLGVISQIDNMTTALVHKDKINEALERAALALSALEQIIPADLEYEEQRCRNGDYVAVDDVVAAIRALKGNTP